MKEKILINVNQLLDGDKRICMKLDPGPQYPIKGDVELDVTLSRSNDSVSVKGSVTFTHRLQCSRCLKDMVRERTEKIDVHYTRPSRIDAELDLAEEDMNKLFYQGELIDLEQPIRDAILLSVPMKPLCKPDCQGLCTRCGKNLNEGKCNCSVEMVDPRWKALGKLLR